MNDPGYKEKMRLRQQKLRDEQPEVLWDYYIRSKYGINATQYHAMYARQGGACKVCQRYIKPALSGASRADTAAIDHCHTTGKVRGLLCTQCNTGLGLFKDNPVNLARAIGYLQENSNV